MRSLKESLATIQKKYSGTIAGNVLDKSIVDCENGICLSLYEVTQDMERLYDITREGSKDKEIAEQAWNELMDMRVVVSSEYPPVDLEMARKEMLYASY